MAAAGKRHYVLKPVTTPLASTADGVGIDAPDAVNGKPANASPYLRAENEDDDGYDPYSDRRSEAPLFEPDPWK